ncbi:hypothetical protein P3S68_023757 [Capsicum galapagoense]
MKVQHFNPIRIDELSKLINKISEQASASQVTNLSNIVISLTSTIICRVAFGIRFDDEAHEKRRFDEILAVTQDMSAGFFSLIIFLYVVGWTNYLEILAILMDVFVAGTDTSAITVIWAMTTLIKNPKVMKEVQEEIRKSIRNKGIVNEDDVQNMSYLRAVIKETLRLYPPAPLLLPRESMEKSVLEGYEIPPKTIVHVNAWAIARDSEIWDTPEELNLYLRDS